MIIHWSLIILLIHYQSKSCYVCLKCACDQCVFDNKCKIHFILCLNSFFLRGHHDCDGMVVGFTTTCMYVISDYPHLNCEFKSNSWRGIVDTTLCDKVGQ